MKKIIEKFKNIYLNIILEIYTRKIIKKNKKE